MKIGLVTVYIPTHNRAKLLDRAISSVLMQDYDDLEIIVIDDGSVDNTSSVLSKYKNNPSVIIIKNDRPMGACYCRNIAINSASGEFITGLDDDDYFMPGRIGDLVGFWVSSCKSKNKFSGLFTGALKLGKNCAQLVNMGEIADINEIMIENVVGSQVFTKTEYLRAAGAFRLDLQAWQDWDTWVRLVKKFGPLLNSGFPSYVIDESHEYFRISNKKEEVLRKVFLDFQINNGPFTRMQKSKLLLSLRSYNQVKFSFIDYFGLFYIIFDIKFLIKKIRIKFLKNR